MELLNKVELLYNTMFRDLRLKMELTGVLLNLCSLTSPNIMMRAVEADHLASSIPPTMITKTMPRIIKKDTRNRTLRLYTRSKKTKI